MRRWPALSDPAGGITSDVRSTPSITRLSLTKSKSAVLQQLVKKADCVGFQVTDPENAFDARPPTLERSMVPEKSNVSDVAKAGARQTQRSECQRHGSEDAASGHRAAPCVKESLSKRRANRPPGRWAGNAPLPHKGSLKASPHTPFVDAGLRTADAGEAPGRLTALTFAPPRF